MATKTKKTVLEWIPVTDRLPDIGADGPVVLAAHGRSVPGVVRYDDDGVWRGAFTERVCAGVTHWAKLPDTSEISA